MNGKQAKKGHRVGIDHPGRRHMAQGTQPKQGSVQDWHAGPRKVWGKAWWR